MTLIFREAKIDDVSALVQLMDQLGYDITPATLAKNLQFYAPCVLVAELDEQVVGCIAYQILPLFHTEAKHLRIVSLIIDKQHRGKGIGKQLLQQIEERAKGCEYVELTSGSHRKEAHQFYRKQNYSSEETVHFRKKSV